MNDETNREVVTVMFRATKFTVESFVKAIDGWLQDMDKSKDKAPKEKSGKMSYKDLMKQKQGAMALEVSDVGIKDFVKIAKKYHIDFAIKKDKSTSPPTYMCFFKAKDKDVMQQCFNEYKKQLDRKKDAPSFKKILEQAKEELNKSREQNRNKQRSRNKKHERSREDHR